MTAIQNGNSERWRETSTREPCPACQKAGWCRVSPDGKWCACRREAQGAKETKQYGDGSEAYIHLIRDEPRNGKPHKTSKPSGEASSNGSPAPAADAETLDRAYRLLLAELQLSEPHRDNLRARGLTDEHIEAGEYRTLPRDTQHHAMKLWYALGNPTAGTIPGLTPTKILAAPGMLIPVRDLAGRIIALRNRPDDPGDGGKYRYLSSRNSKNPEGPSPGSPAHVPQGITGHCLVARMTEGELKADYAWRRSGMATVSFPGVASWRAVLPVFAELQCKTIRVAFDADAESNATVASCLRECVKGLAALGYAIELERWPIEVGKGIDDLLLAGGTPEVLTGPDAMQAVRDIAKAAGATELAPPAEQPEGSGSQVRTDGRHTIKLSTDEHVSIKEAIEALADEPTVFTRGGKLVDVLRDSTPKTRDGVKASGSPKIDPTPIPRIRTKLTSCIEFVKVVQAEDGEKQIAIHPPDWLVKGVAYAGQWGGIRHLEAVVTSPVMREDGSILQQPGYDPETGVLYEPLTEYPPIPDNPTAEEVQTAVDALLEVVQDFPFEKPDHRAAWLAATLTPPARFAFRGPAPLFLLDANAAGAGKGKAVQASVRISTGDELATASFTRDDNEMRKVITSIAIAGERVVLWDNLEGTFGGASLDAALTSTKWKGRVLGLTQTVELPLNVTWFGTGNNIVLGSDMPRRVCHIRLNCRCEKPEERSDFAHDNLLEWVSSERVRLFTSVLTILRGYVAAGRPDMRLKPWGSYEGWSALVRNCVAWCGVGDPGATRNELAKYMNTDAIQLKALLDGWQELDPRGTGLTTSEAFHQLRAATSDKYPAMRAALDECCTGSKGEPPTAKALGYKLRKFFRKVVDGRCFDHANENKAGIVWTVIGGDGGDGGDISFPTQARTRTHAHAGEILATSETSPPSPPSPPVGCQHPTTIEVPSFGGYIHIECGICGKVLEKPRKMEVATP